MNGSHATHREWDLGEYHPSARPDIYNQTVRTAGWRLTIYPEQPVWGELFDLKSDPGEHRNLFHSPPQQRIRKELEALLAEQFPPQTSVDNELLCKW